MIAQWVWPVLLGLLGGVFGSHIATVALRWPEGRSAMRGRSACDGCGRTLRAFELLPIASYLVQRGRCRSCAKPIAPSHFGSEAIGVAIGVAAGVLAPGVEGVAGAVFGWLLLALGAIDRVAFVLPDPLNAALALAGLATGLVGLQPAPAERLIGGAAGFGSLWLVAVAYRRLRGRIGLGGGDPKLMGAIGLWLGWRPLPGVLLAACLLGLGWVLLRAAQGRRMGAVDRMPFGTLLAPAAFAMWCVALR